MSGIEKPHELRDMVVSLERRVATLEEALKVEVARLTEENQVLREQVSKR
jgi:hypothetical protein